MNEEPDRILTPGTVTLLPRYELQLLHYYCYIRPQAQPFPWDHVCDKSTGSESCES
jgi:hypothetical protein